MTRMAFNGLLDAGTLLHRCSHCASDLDRHGRLCRKCYNRRIWKGILGTAAGLELFVAAAIAIKPLKLPSTTNEDQAAIQAPAPVQRAAVEPRTPQGPSGWLYFDSTDPLINDVTHHARLIGNSPDSAKTRPNQHMTSGVLELSASGHYGRQVVVSFPRIRTACTANPCTVRAAFDAQPSEVYGFADVSDGDSTILMLKDFDRLTSSMMHAQNLAITASMGTETETVLSFNVSGYRMKLASAWPVHLAAAR